MFCADEYLQLRVFVNIIGRVFEACPCKTSILLKNIYTREILIIYGKKGKFFFLILTWIHIKIFHFDLFIPLRTSSFHSRLLIAI